MAELANIDSILSHIVPFIEDHTPIPVSFNKWCIVNSSIQHYVISDVHIWKRNTNRIINRLDHIHKHIISSAEWVVHITLLWDLVETLALWWMHPGQIEDMDWPFGKELLFEVVNIFERFLYSIASSGKEVHVHAIPWNHDRMTRTKEDDIDFTGWFIIYHLIKQWVKLAVKSFDIYNSKIGFFDIENIRYIIHHWDNTRIQRSAQEKLVLSHWVIWQWRYNIILSWDKHHAELNEWKDYTTIICPALAWPGKYDIDNNFHSMPWFYTIIENQFKSADVSLHRLPI